MHRRDRSKHNSDSPLQPGWQGFTFVSQKHHSQDSAEPSPSLQNNGDPVQMRCLSQTLAGDRVRIIALHQDANNLITRGLTSGVTVQIVSRTASGSVVVLLHGKSLGIGSAMAQSIIVEPI
ncbi:MAG: ferrous iron transport protein A [Stenomitos rutilans HA7619-LM2]|jgi:Fe2+ transport system protein FeoA|nr:ferrous iron transport protein A [Stenomitos rutilans HA7619-LM2]